MKILITFLSTLLTVGLFAQSNTTHSNNSTNTLEYRISPNDHLEVGQGAVVDDLRKISANFDEIVIGNGIQLNLVPSSNYVHVKAQENILPLVETKIVNGKLLISLNSSLKTNKGIEIEMAMGKASSLNLKEGARLRMKETLKIDKLKMQVESGSHIKMGLEANTFDLTLKEGSFMELEGSANHSELSVTEGSILKAKDYETNTANVSVLDASICSVDVDNSLEARVENASILTYYGKPTLEREQLSNLGIINRK